MPNRIIRDAALSSKKLASISAEAERLFWRLLMVADDFGRFQSEPSIILARCFPLQVKDFSIRHVVKWYAELTRCGAILAYSVNGDTFGQFAVWNQRLRSANSKYPPPSDGQVTVIRPSAAHGDGDGDGDVIETETKTDSPNGEKFEEFWLKYPRKKNKGDAEKAWKALRPSEPLVVRILAAVAAQRRCFDWLKDGGKWIPYPASWLRAKAWEDAVDTRLDDELPPAI